MLRTLFLAAATSLLLSTAAAAQPVATSAEVKKITDQIMAQVGAGHLEAGFKLMKPRTIVPEAEFDAMIGQAKLQIPAMSQRFGANLGHEFLREDKAGENLIRYTYLQRFDKHAMRWIFYAYHGKGGWVINTFQFDDKIATLFP